MCMWCNQHGDRDHKWYEKLENFIFEKTFNEEEREKIKEEMRGGFAQTEWRYSEPEFIRNKEFLEKRASGNTGFASQVVTKEECLKILELAEEATKREDSLVVVGHCPCEMVYNATRAYQCIGFGMPVSMSMEVAYGRLPKEGVTEFGGAEWSKLRREIREGVKVPLKLEEAEELLDDWEKRGLYHLVATRGHLPLVEAICNCDKKYCTFGMNRLRSGVKEYLLKGHFVAVINPIECTDCGTCYEYCQFGAIHFSKDLDNVMIDPTQCYGCGLCYSQCPNDAISLVPRQEIPATKDLW